MDLCLGLGLGDTMMNLMEKMSNTSVGGDSSEASGTASPRAGSFSWSFVSRDHHHSGAKNGGGSNGDDMSVATSQDSGCTDSESVGVSSAGDFSPCQSPRSPGIKSPRSHLIKSLFSSGSRKKGTRRPGVLDKVPFCRRADYLTVHVETRSGRSEKYVVSKRLLSHPLFKVLMKCSEDEYGEDFEIKNGAVAVVCDPALFLEVVKAVDDEMSSSEHHAEADEDSSSVSSGSCSGGSTPRSSLPS